jgi:hypothetical protein
VDGGNFITRNFIISNIYQNIIRMIKPRMMRKAGHVARSRGAYLIGRCEKKYLLGDLGVDGRILLYTVLMMTSAMSPVRCTPWRSGSRAAHSGWPMLSNTRAVVGTSEQSVRSHWQENCTCTWRCGDCQLLNKYSDVVRWLRNYQKMSNIYDRYLGNFSRDVKTFLL